MTKQLIKLIASLCLFFLTYKPLLAKDQPYELQGTITGAYSGKIYLVFEDNFAKKDSLGCDIRDGKFYFKGKAKTPILARLSLKGYGYMTDFYLEGGKSTMTCEGNFSVNGEDTLRSIKINKYDPGKTEAEMVELMASISAIDHNGKKSNSELYYKAFTDFIIKKPGSKAGAYLVGSYASLMSYDQLLNISKLFDASLKNTFELGMIEKAKNAGLRQPGMTFHDIAAKDTNGNVIATKQFRGKYLLVVRWASWCGPCRKEHPALNAMYEKYKDKGFALLGISIDAEKDNNKWKNAIITDKLEWPQISELNDGNDELAKYYKLEGTGVPFSFLIDKEGKIIGSEMSIKEVEAFLAKTL